MRKGSSRPKAGPYNDGTGLKPIGRGEARDPYESDSSEASVGKKRTETREFCQGFVPCPNADKCVDSGLGRPNKADRPSRGPPGCRVPTTQRGTGTTSPEAVPLLSEALHIPPRAGRARSTLREGFSASPLLEERGRGASGGPRTQSGWRAQNFDGQAGKGRHAGCHGREEGEKTGLDVAAAAAGGGADFVSCGGGLI